MQLEAINIEKAFDGSGTILRDINLCLNNGESISITAPSGRGKSTLLSVMGLLLRPTKGEILLDGRNISGLSDKEKAAVRNKHFGFVFQSAQLIGSLTALENTCVPALLAGEKKTERALELLEQFGMKERANYYPHQLSIGQLRRLSVARAMLMDAPFIFADEPTNDLDPENSQVIMDYLLDIPNQGRSLILVTHDAEFASKTNKQYLLNDSGTLSLNK
ncbi:ABC transporter ATP-binding protein [Ruminococcaceae bacterium AM28-23LB]|nr:ABC transporter ATP-binding protein [Ruminococcaceae bacterium AM28-23LB]